MKSILCLTGEQVEFSNRYFNADLRSDDSVFITVGDEIGFKILYREGGYLLYMLAISRIEYRRCNKTKAEYRRKGREFTIFNDYGTPFSFIVHDLDDQLESLLIMAELPKRR